MSEQKKKFMEDNTRLMAEMDEESLAKVNAFLTGVTIAVKARKPAKDAQTDEAKADERKEG